eukprot:6178391-Pleurochrysis_carterae.AAC.2
MSAGKCGSRNNCEHLFAGTIFICQVLHTVLEEQRALRRPDLEASARRVIMKEAGGCAQQLTQEHAE